MRKNSEIICNQCGRILTKENDLIIEGYLGINQDWGYFSNKDGEVHQIDLCEMCYDEWVSHFQIPVDIVTKTEMI